MERITGYITKLLLSSTWVRHGLFWGVFLILMSTALVSLVDTPDAAFQFAGQWIIAVCVFYSGYFLYRLSRHYSNPLLLVVGVFFGSALIGSYVSYEFYTWQFPARELSPIYWYPFYLFVSFMAIALKFAKDMYVWQQEEFARKQQHAEMELNFLRSQISPHFLFNTLNNLYGHAVTKSEQLPDMMLRLSDLLRYSIYDASRPLVPLADELDYIQNYVALEKLRLSESSTVEFDIPTSIDQRLQIAPLILITFIENAFKHSRDNVGGELRITGSVKIEGDKLIMQVDNTFSESGKDVSEKKAGGIGLQNTLKRLEMVYGQRYRLNATQQNGIYSVNLEIDL